MSEKTTRKHFLHCCEVTAEPMTLTEAWQKGLAPSDNYVSEGWRGEERGYLVPYDGDHASWLPASDMEENGYRPFGTSEERLRVMQDSLRRLDECLIGLYKETGGAETGRLVMDAEMCVSVAWSKLETLLAEMAKERIGEGKETDDD